ncbi:hypothetical protein KBA73_00665 [Patescibacteria group bacterium]|nr:hypothetical protein [Patescibacteria group bacterium]
MLRYNAELMASAGRFEERVNPGLRWFFDSSENILRCEDPAIIEDLLRTVLMKSGTHKNTLRVVEQMEKVIRHVYEVIDVPGHERNAHLKDAISSFLERNTFSDLHDYVEKQDVLKWISMTAGVPLPKVSESNLSLVKMRLETCSGEKDESLKQLPAYVDAIIPQIKAYFAETESTMDVSSYLELIRVYHSLGYAVCFQKRNPFYLEQLSAFSRQGLLRAFLQGCSYTEFIVSTLRSHVAELGPTFDPTLFEREFGMAPANYDQALVEYYQNSSTPGADKEGREGSLLERAIGVYLRKGPEINRAIDGTEIATLLREADVSNEERVQVFTRLVHALFVQKRETFVWKDTVKNWVEATAQIGLPFEQQNQLVQEVYARFLELQEGTRGFGELEELRERFPIDLSHPNILACRERVMLRGLQSLYSWEQMESDLKRHAFFLDVHDWSPAFRQKMQESLAYDSVRAEFSPGIEKELQRDSPLPLPVQAFIDSLEEDHYPNPKSDFLEELFLVYGKGFRELCRQDPAVERSYNGWLIRAVSIGYCSFEEIASKPGYNPAVLDEEIGRRVLSEMAESCWGNPRGAAQRLTEFQGAFPVLAASLESDIERIFVETIATMCKQNDVAKHGQCFTTRQLVESFPSFAAKAMARDSLISEKIHYALTKTYEYANADAVDTFLASPLIERHHPAIEIFLARRAIKSLAYRPSEDFEREMKLVTWSPSLLKRLAPDIADLITVLRSIPEMNEKSIQNIKQFQEGTGCLLTDPQYWMSKRAASTIHALIRYLKDWQRFSEQFGARPTSQTTIKKVVGQSTVDALNESFQYSYYPDKGALIFLKEQTGIVPSTKALHQRALNILENGSFGAPEDVEEIAKALGVSFLYTIEEVQMLEERTPRGEAMLYTHIKAHADKKLVPVLERVFRARFPISSIIPELLAIQSPAKRSQFCPYDQKLRGFIREQDVDLSVEKEKKGLLLFLKQFGFEKLPLLFKVCCELSTKDYSERLEQGNCPELRDLHALLKIKDQTLSVDQYIARIHEAMKEIRQLILEDRPLGPELEQSPLGMEFFNALVPSVGTYQRVEDRAQLLAAIRMRPDLKKADWYEPVTFKVNAADTEQDIETGSAGLERAIETRLTLINQKLEDEAMEHLFQLWEKGAVLMEREETGTSRAFWLSLVRDRFIAEHKSLSERLETVTAVKGREAIEKKLSKLTESIVFLEAEAQKESASPEELIEIIQGRFLNPAGKVDRVQLEATAGDAIRALLLVLMREHSPRHYEGVLGARQVDMRQQAGVLSYAQLYSWHAWFQEEYLEHFAGIREDAQVLLSASLQATFQKMWRIDGLIGELKRRATHPEEEKKPIGHPIIDSFDRVNVLNREIDSLRNSQSIEKKEEMTFWPTKGIGRALSGDIANACFHNYRTQLAQGDYSGITALLMTVEAQSEIAGSTLLIDTQTVQGNRVFVIRALNPTEAILRKRINPTALVEATIQYVIQMAENVLRMGGSPVTEIRLCYDQRGGHSTNRTEIFDAETALVKKNRWNYPTIPLVCTPETQFNGYAIYNTLATRVVWQAEPEPILAEIVEDL